PFWQAMRRAGSDYTDMGLLRGYGLFFLYAGIPDAPRQVILPFGDFTHWPGQMVMQISRFVASRFGDGFAEAAAQRYINAVGRGSFLPELWYDVFEFIGYDAGRSTDYQYPANQTAYHNAILVDGIGQLGDTRVSDSNYGNGWFFNRVSTPLFTPTGTADYAIAGGKGAQLFATTLGISRW